MMMMTTIIIIKIIIIIIIIIIISLLSLLSLLVWIRLLLFPFLIIINPYKHRIPQIQGPVTFHGAKRILLTLLNSPARSCHWSIFRNWWRNNSWPGPPTRPSTHGMVPWPLGDSPRSVRLFGVGLEKAIKSHEPNNKTHRNGWMTWFGWWFGWLISLLWYLVGWKKSGLGEVILAVSFNEKPGISLGNRSSAKI